jgi:transposase
MYLLNEDVSLLVEHLDSDADLAWLAPNGPGCWIATGHHPPLASRWRDHRQVIAGILHRIRTGAHWRDLPEQFAPWKTVYERHRLWSADGTWEYLLQQIQAAADADGEADWHISVDSTTGRAHQHAAGARIAPPAPVPKGRRQRTDGRSSLAELVRPPGTGGAGAEGLGRSRGGFTAKIHPSADGRCRPLSLLITEGQRADCRQFEAVLDKSGNQAREPGTGRQ